MFGTEKKEDATPLAADQLRAATDQRSEIEAGLGRLQQTAKAATAARELAYAELERVEGDALIGMASDTDVKRARERHESAVTSARQAEAKLRKATDDLGRLQEVIDRLEPVHREQRQAELHAQYRETVLALRDRLLDPELQSLNRKLRELVEAGDKEFPWAYRGQKERPRPYRLCAGLPNLALTHLSISHEGGRQTPLDQWLDRVEAYLNPPPPVEVPKRNIFELLYGPAPTDGSRRVAGQKWYQGAK